MEKTIKIEGMSCNHCVGRVTKTLESLENVISCSVSLKDKTATIKLSSDIDNNTINEVIDDIGFDVIEIK